MQKMTLDHALHVFSLPHSHAAAYYHDFPTRSLATILGVASTERDIEAHRVAWLYLLDF